jgi:plastocyanin
MSILGRRISTVRVAVIAAVFVLGSGLALTARRGETREITLVAKEMAFYVAGDEKNANPVIQARPGETLRIVLQNRDRGMKHDFAVPALDAATDALDWNEEAAVTIDVPDEPGTYEYVCRPHILMMKGRLIVND